MTVDAHLIRARRCLVVAGVLACAALASGQPRPMPQSSPTAPTGVAPAPAPTGEPAPQPPPVAPPPAPTGAPSGSPTTAPVGEPREAVVQLKDGQRYTGELVEQGPQRIVLKIAGIETPIQLSLVDSVEVLPPVLERYRAMRATIDDNDVERLLLVVEWLRARDQWELALAELDHILDLQPDNGEARRLKLLVEAQRNLTQNQTYPAPKADVVPAPALVDFPLLSEKDVNLIKVYEADLADPPRMLIDRETITRLLEEHAADPLIPKNPQERDAIYRWSPARILDLMFRVQARNLYANVKVLDAPRPMRLFRDDLNRGLIANNCATSRCHGGVEAGRLMLTNKRPNSDQSVYTNFLILERFKLPDGKPMINYDEPGASPLLNMALPRDVAAVKHPQVPGPGGRGDLWKPFFKSTDDPRFQAGLEWIQSMYRPRPDYPIEYHSPAPEPVRPKPGEKPVVR